MTFSPAPVQQRGYTIPDQASSLEAEQLAKYIDLIRTDTPEALSVAQAIHWNAKRDASDVRDCRQALRLIAEAQKPEPRRKLGKLEDKLKVLRDEIERLEVVATELENELRLAERTLPSPHQFRRRITIISANSIVKLALREELEAAGI
jgi:hypothetical protein